ncbi:MAG: SusC/RagA family TonB-linked outer membrane protein, partial [Ferruginibacter sp.]
MKLIACSNIFRLQRKTVAKTWLIMKMSAILLFALSFNAGANTYSQNITLSLKHAPLQKVFREISRQTGYKFVYTESLLQKAKKVTISATDASLDQVLAESFKDQSLTYTFLNKFIIIKEKVVLIQNETLLPPPPIVIKGLVNDEEGNPLKGVSVLIKGTNFGTSTDENGSFSIEIPDGNTKVLVFSFVGMLDQEINTVGKTDIRIKMHVDDKLQKDIVVIGYGSQKRKDLTGAITSLGEEKFRERNVVSLVQAMAGQAAGVQIAPRNASPGKPSIVVIRGIGSITAGFAPLYVIDGFPVDQQNADALNPNDIQSVDVLKDASATAIYGSRGANGVIIITTKTGNKGKPTFNFSASYGSSKVNENDFFDMLDAKEYVQYMKEAAQNTGTAVRSPIANWDGSTNTNWQELIYQKAPFSNYSLSGSGGSDNTTYNWSLGYTNEVGIVKGTDFKKFTARVRVDFNPSKKFHIGINIAPNYQLSTNMPDGDFNSPMGAAVFMPPIIPVKMPDGSYGNTQKFPGISDIQIANPLEIIDLYKDKTKGLFSMVNSVIEYEILSGLKLRSTIGVNTTGVVNEVFSPSTLPPLPHSPSASYNNSSYLNWVNENTITYNKVFKKDHSINILGGFTSQRQDNTNVYVAANNFPTNFVETLNGGVITPSATGTTKSAWSLLSYLARANYIYKGRYILTGSIRTDGSSRFGANKRYGVFPSGAVAWRLSEEPF